MVEYRIFILLISSSYLLPFFANGRAIPPISRAPSPDEAESPKSIMSYNDLRLSKPNPDLKRICGATDHPTECVTSIAQFQTSKWDPISVLKLEIQALRQGFQNASNTAKIYNDAPSASETLRSCLDACLDMYESGMYDLDDAVEAIADHDIPKLQAVLSATISDINSCDETFREEPELVFPLKEHSVSLMKIASNNLAIVDTFIEE